MGRKVQIWLSSYWVFYVHRITVRRVQHSNQCCGNNFHLLCPPMSAIWWKRICFKKTFKSEEDFGRNSCGCGCHLLRWLKEHLWICLLLFSVLVHAIFYNFLRFLLGWKSRGSQFCLLQIRKHRPPWRLQSDGQMYNGKKYIWYTWSVCKSTCMQTERHTHSCPLFPFIILLPIPQQQ